MALLGLDIGSSSIKGVVFDEKGKALAQSDESYKTVWIGSHAEADAEKIWNAAIKTIKSAAKKVPNIEAICVSSHGETFIPVDNNCLPVYPALMNSDHRAVEESEFWEKNMGKRELYKITGVPLHPMFSINKIMWLKKNKPEVFSITKKFLSPHDYILGRLGACPYTDYSLACRTMAFNINKRMWSDDILETAGVKKDLLPDCVPSGTAAGRVKDDVSRALGLKKGVKVVAGGHDQPLSAIGCGGVKEGIITDSAGSFECVAAISNEPKNSDKAYDYNLNSYCHAVDGKYITLAFFPSGLVSGWFVDEFCFKDRLEAEKRGISVYLHLSKKMEKNPTGICVTPHLIGSCNPFWDMKARGAIYGLSQDTSRQRLFKAVYEGLACELSLNIKALSDVCGSFDSVIISGGNARWPFSVQMRSDITGKTFHTLKDSQSVCRGAAILAGTASGIYKNLEDAAKKTVKTYRKYSPDCRASESYKKQKAMYENLYPSLKSVREV